MAEMATYVGVTPRTIAASSAAALVKGVRVTRSSAGVCAVTAIGTRGDYTTLTEIPASDYGMAVSLSDGGKVPALAGEDATAGAIAYSFASGKYGVTSTSAVVMGRWTTTTSSGQVGEVELQTAT